MTKDPKAVVERAFACLNEHDLDAYYALCADDFTYTGMTTTRGRDVARQIDAAAFAALPDHWRRVERILVSGDTVAVWLVFGGTSPATGEPFEIEFCDVFEVREGLIQSITMYADWPALLQQIGAG
ncbi:MAG: nuclear transport factor 2 family protein [Enhygromyxa sp.]